MTDPAPYDLSRTSRIFGKRPYGAIEALVADDPTDTELVAQVRDQVAAEAAARRARDFSDPHVSAPEHAIHLARAGGVHIEITRCAGGAEIHYRAAGDAERRCLQAWIAERASARV